MADLKGRIALVTGASRGVGRGIAEGLAEAGATIYLTARSSSSSEPPEPGTLEATAASVAALGGRPVAVELDHADDDAVAALFRRIEAESGRLDLLVNNAYPWPRPGRRPLRFWEAPLSAWDDQAAVGLRGYYVAAALGARLMVAQGNGLIVNVSSAGTDAYAADHALNTIYGVAKAGTDRMARDMASELEAHGVAALALVPGAVRTEATPDAVGNDGVARRHQSPRFVGRSVAALAMDPDIMEKTGGRYRVDELVREYRFSEPGWETA
ncbi:MAG: SDR family NAD(P)-dependent oxidoreductase [Pseudomonadales bacterium]